MSINWQSLRALNTSQNAAFEELCCQLAAYEPTPPGSIFLRKGTPDAGVECYWTLPNGDEWAWQAKFFTSSLDEKQWAQLDDSVRTALGKHTRLTVYTVCLPLDRSDPRIDRQNWFLDKWNKRVEKWQGWARQAKLSVEFRYWGEHEIWERISREEHRGRFFFWFNKELFSKQWFQRRVEEAVANAGPRYSPELHVGLPIAKVFDGLGRTPAFYERIESLYADIAKAYSQTNPNSSDPDIQRQHNHLDEIANQLLPILRNIRGSEADKIDFELIADLASQLRRTAWEVSSEFEKAGRRDRQDRDSAQAHHPSEPTKYSYQCHYLSKLADELSALIRLTRSAEFNLANTPALLVVGDAGTGKSHLFCDVASQRGASEIPTVLLLGEQFGNDEPWAQIVKLLGLSCGKEEFLGALEAAAQAAGAKALILIDALNEGEGKTLWRRHIAGILTTLSRYPWLSVAVSVRSSYEGTVIPEGLVPDRLIRVEHHGFARHEFEATQTFFEYYAIKAPSVPLLNPEFQNPLFLKLFCKGLKNRGLTELPVGLQGITAIFNFFVESVEEKLSKPELLNFDPKSRVVQRGVEALIERMTQSGRRWVPREEARGAVDSLLPRGGYEDSLFRHMISEGLLAEDRAPAEPDRNEWIEGVHFSYERLSDHLLAKRFLDQHLDVNSPSATFSPDKPLSSCVESQSSSWANRGLIEALSIQIPERIGKEFVDCVPHCAGWQPVKEAFVESIMWRSTGAITDTTLKYVSDQISSDERVFSKYLDALLTVASNTGHPLNADHLHGSLKDQKLAERDAWWSIFLHEQYQEREHTAVHRLVAWAWSASDKSHISDESMRLCGTALAWFLTTSNRFLRDRATQALVALLTNRINVLRKIIPQFLGVDDPYVLERLYAVAYGCAMRSTDNKGISELAADVYEWVFSSGEPPPHITLRDYARGVIEVALHRNATLLIDVSKIRPPYKSDFPTDIPSEEELQEHGKWSQDMTDAEWARRAIYHSVMDQEDFARYVIGTNFGSFEWTSRRIGEPRRPTRQERFDAFLASLTARQKRIWERYETLRKNYDFYRLLNEDKRHEVYGSQVKEEDFQAYLAYLEERLRIKLGKKKGSVFQDEVLPYLNNPPTHGEEYGFNLSIAQRWILQRVFDLGWTGERFGTFDRYVNWRTNDYRTAHKPERIGKKYQWLAYHEFLARVSDNFEFKGDHWSGQNETYEGPWQAFTRDIDPSCLLRETGREVWKEPKKTWWFPVSYAPWEINVNSDAWLRSIEDVPAPQQLIEVINPADGSKWLALEGYCVGSACTARRGSL